MNSFSRSLPMMLYRALDAVLPEFRAIFAQFGLTEPQWRTLRVLWEHDGASAVELARVTLIAPPSLVGVLDRMQRADLLERRPSPTDRRQVQVYLRPRGRTIERSVRPLVEAAYGRLRSALSAAEWNALYAALDRLCDVRAEAASPARVLDARRATSGRSGAAPGRARPRARTERATARTAARRRS